MVMSMVSTQEWAEFCSLEGGAGGEASPPEVPVLSWEEERDAHWALCQEEGRGRRQVFFMAPFSESGSDDSEALDLYYELEYSGDEEEPTFWDTKGPLFNYRAGRTDYLLQEVDGSLQVTAYNLLETADVGHLLLDAAKTRLGGGGGRQGNLRAQVLVHQLGKDGLANLRFQ